MAKPYTSGTEFCESNGKKMMKKMLVGYAL